MPQITTVDDTISDSNSSHDSDVSRDGSAELSFESTLRDIERFVSKDCI
jgi:hypothetical protein